MFQFSTKTAEADTSSELAKKSKETFRKEVRPTLSEYHPLDSLFLTPNLILPSCFSIVLLLDVPVHCAMSESLSEARLQIWTHQQHGRF